MSFQQLDKIYRIARHNSDVEIDFEEPFFGFRLFSNGDKIFKPEISIYLPYLKETVQQKYIFNKGWQPFETLFFRDISHGIKTTIKVVRGSQLRETLSSKMNHHVLQTFTPPGPASETFYKYLVKELELYHVRDHVVQNSCEDYSTITEFNMLHFRPEPNYYFIKSPDLIHYSGSAYKLQGFEKPEHLGSFYEMSKKDFRKNIKSLFL